MSGINPAFICETFNASLINENDIDLKYYLTAYEELYKLCSLMGTIFSFVGSEILSKMSVLRDLKNNDVSGHFASMRTMTSYEINENLLHKSDYVSGSRTLLRLHRGLAFISLFLSKVYHLDMHDGTSQAGREAYDQTLSQHHTWFVRSGAAIAMFSLPTKEGLLRKVCVNNIEDCLRELPRMLEMMDTVYDRVQRHYVEHDLLNLP